MEKNRGKRKRKVGVVVSDKMDKTISVSIERVIQHPKYLKVIRKHMILKAHDENREAKMGDVVEVMETRPLSKTKMWRLVRIVDKKGREE